MLIKSLQELINELCPDGVEYNKLKDVCDDFIVPMRDRPKVFDGDVDWCRIEDKEGQYFHGSKSGLAVSQKVIDEMNLKVFPIGTVICSCSASLGNYAINTKPLITNQTFIGLVCGKNLYNKYLLYVMENSTNQLSMLATTGTIPYISRVKFEEFEIPVPPLPIQEEIVRILDKFTELTSELTSELTAELTARKQQYEYYRDELLTFGDDVERKPLGEVCYIKARIGWQRLNKSEYLNEGDFYLITGVDIKSGRIDFNRCHYVSKERYDMDTNIQLKNGDLIITKDGTIGKVALIEDMDKPGVLNSHLFVIRDISGKLLHKYLYYLFNSNYFKDFIENNKTQGTIAGLNQATMVNFQIPIPSIPEQERIVALLDRFDALCNDITAGLPAEIEARQQQYEYYRNLLLTFKRKDVA